MPSAMASGALGLINTPELRFLPDGRVAVWYASEVFIDQHQSSFDIELGRVRIDKLDTYRHLFVWREYSLPTPHPTPHRRFVERYDHARLSDFSVDTDGYATHSGLRPLRVTSAFIRPKPDSIDWIIVRGLEPGTVIRVTDSKGQIHMFVYAPDVSKTRP